MQPIPEYFDRGDVMELGLGMLAATIIVIMLVLPYWALVGFPLAAPRPWQFDAVGALTMQVKATVRLVGRAWEW